MDCKFVIKVGEGTKSFDTKEAAAKYIRENQLYEGIAKKTEATQSTEDLALALRQVNFGENHFTPEELRKFQDTLLTAFVDLETDASYFYKIGAATALSKGLGKSFEQIDNTKRSMMELGIGTSEFDDNIPFDARRLLTGDSQYGKGYYHKITANNLKIMNEIDSLSKTMFMERTPSFIDITNKTLSNLKPSVSNDQGKIEDLKDELSAFSQIAAYKRWIEANDNKTSTLRNSLIYDGSGLEGIVDIAKEAVELAPANTFLQFILPVSTTVKTSKKQQKNILNRDLINTIEGKTRGKLEPDLVANLMDSFTELYQNPKTQYHAKALFDYLIVKDGLMFKNKSFIRMLPTFMFNEMSKATENATKLLAANTTAEFKNILRELDKTEIYDKEGNEVEYFTDEERRKYNDLFKDKDILAVKDALYKKVFGFDANGLFDKFENIYSTDIRNQFNLDLIKPFITARKTGVKKTAEGLTAAKDENGRYVHVSMFTEKFKATEKGSEERKQALMNTISDLEDAGFSLSPHSVNNPDDSSKNRLYLEFKKHIRLREKTGQYKLYELVSVLRDKKTYSANGLTAQGESVPRGTYAVYKEVDAVGTSNSVGVADLGTRPSKEQIQKEIAKKTAANKPVVQNAPVITSTDASTATPVAPQESTGESVGGGIFGGLQQMNYDPAEFGDSPLGFFSDEQINDEPC